MPPAAAAPPPPEAELAGEAAALIAAAAALRPSMGLNTDEVFRLAAPRGLLRLATAAALARPSGSPTRGNSEAAPMAEFFPPTEDTGEPLSMTSKRHKV